MARRNISLPDELDEQARAARLNVSALTRRALVAELDRRERMARLDAWLDELDEKHGPPSARAMAAARRWASGAVQAVETPVAGSDAGRRHRPKPGSSSARKRAAG